MIEFLSCDAKFILHVEKDTVWRRFNEDKFWRKHNCIQRTAVVNLPRRAACSIECTKNSSCRFCLLDNDPWGYYIYSVIKQGSINLAFESRRMAIPSAKFIGLRSRDFEAGELSPSVTIKLTDQDIKRAKQIAKYPWFTDKKPWQRRSRGC
ncbi:MAG: hypothetical protein R3B96_06260 [Pirellulaceae bacterium]